MGVGPIEGRAAPSDRTDTKSGPANAAPVTDKPLPTNVTAGNLAPSKSAAKIKELDAAITRDLAAVRKAEAAADEAARQMGAHPNDGPSTIAFELAKQRFDRAQAELDRHVELAFTARLPKFDRGSFDRQLDAIGREMAIRYGSDREIWHAINNAKIKVEEGLPDAQHAAVIGKNP